MSAYHRLRWKKTLNEYRFLKEELKFIKSIAKEAAPNFQKHYENFLSEREIDLTELNDSHQEGIKEAYGIEEEVSGEVPHIECNGTELVTKKHQVEKTEEVQLSEDEIAIHNLFSKVFKNIALKVHPDKIDLYQHDYKQRRQMEEDFKNANQALKERDYFILIEIAEKLDIPLPKNYNQQTRWMKDKVADINMQINNEKKTYNYIFSEAETDAEKDTVISQFVQQLFGLNL
jgi:hypothetical protein